MARFISVSLRKRGVSCIARLLDDEAPRTAAAIWDGLPQSGQVFHGKYARNEIYYLVPAFAREEPGPENTTVTPIPGDLCYFTFNERILHTPGHGYSDDDQSWPSGAVIDLALFYGRNNLLLNGDMGWVPGNVFGTVVEGLTEMAAACQSIWMDGARGEVLEFSRHSEE